MRTAAAIAALFALLYWALTVDPRDMPARSRDW